MAIVVSVTYYKQCISREKAVIVQKCCTNGFVTLLYAFLQCNPYTGPWKLWAIEVLLSSSIKAVFAIELSCYTFSRLYPHLHRLVSYECTTTMVWVMGPKYLFLNKITAFVGHIEVTLRPGQLEQSTAITNSFFFLYLTLLILTVKQFCGTAQAVWFSPAQCRKTHMGEKKTKRERNTQRTRVNHRAFSLFENVNIKEKLFFIGGGMLVGRKCFPAAEQIGVLSQTNSLK